MNILIAMVSQNEAAFSAAYQSFGAFARTATGEPITRVEFPLEWNGTPKVSAVAEEVFDLTNNPAREDERELMGLAQIRSLSVGDRVVIKTPTGKEIALLCMSQGWQRVEVE